MPSELRHFKPVEIGIEVEWLPRTVPQGVRADELRMALDALGIVGPAVLRDRLLRVAHRRVLMREEVLLGLLLLTLFQIVVLYVLFI